MSLENRHVVSGGGGRSLGVSGRHGLGVFLVGRWRLWLSSVGGVPSQCRVLWHPMQIGVGKDELTGVGKSG